MALALLAALAACGDDPSPATTTVARAVPTATPSIVLIDVAGLRLDLFGAQVREPATPADARPAPTRFLQACAPAGSSVPSLASAFTGVAAMDLSGIDASSAGVRCLLNPPAYTLAERLAEDGYDTIAFSDPHHLDPYAGLDQGFGPRWRKVTGPTAVTDAAVAWLGARRDAKPFLLFVALDVGAFNAPAGLDAVAGWVARSKAAEAQVTRLRQAAAPVLGATGLEIVCSDHGVGLGEDGAPAPARGGQVTDLRLRARLEIRGPGFPPVDVQGSCSLTDLVPTVIDAMGVPPDPSLAGASLRWLAAHPEDPGWPAVAAEWRLDPQGGGHVERRLHVVRTTRWKYVATFTASPAGFTEACFDLRLDPRESAAAEPGDLAPYGDAFARRVGAIRDVLSGRTHMLRNDPILPGYGVGGK